MCDCYIAQCDICQCDVSIHIGDWSTERENLKVYCHRCTRGIKKRGIPKAAIVILDPIERTSQVEGATTRHIGQEVLILCSDPNAHDIYLN